MHFALMDFLARHLYFADKDLLMDITNGMPLVVEPTRAPAPPGCHSMTGLLASLNETAKWSSG